MIAAAVAAASHAAPARAARGSGPAGSLLIVEENHAVPMVTVILAARAGSASDPHDKQGLANLAAQLARHGAAKKTRTDLDAALDALGATLDVHTDTDSTRFEGRVLSKNLDAFLALLADVVVKPDFAAAELTRTRHELESAIDESRDDDRTLAARFFQRNLFGEHHPYAQPAAGTRPGLERIKREDLAGWFKTTFVGKNVVFALAGDVTADEAAAKLKTAFARMKDGPAARVPDMPPLQGPKGWSIQLVDKPEREQVQIMFGHPTLKASDPDYLPLSVALAAFGGHAMKATLMEEIRVNRGLAYGAYMSLAPGKTACSTRGWVASGNDKAVTSLKLVLKLYKELMNKGVSDERLAFFQGYLAGAFASEMDAPEHRLEARVDGEMAGLPEDFLDTYVAKVKAVTPAQVAAALKKWVTAGDLAITMVATASTMKKMLTSAGIKEAAIDVVKFDDEKF